MTTIKDRILVALARIGTAHTAKDLMPICGTDHHNITHVIWRLQKEGLVTFSESATKSKVGRKVVTRIRLTDAGVDRAQRTMDQ